MRYLFVLMFMTSWLYSATIAVVMLPDRKQVLSNSVSLPIQNALVQELGNFSEDFDVKVLANVNEEFKFKYAAEGFGYLQGFATSQQSDIVVVLEYKQGAQAILVQLFVADGTNVSKNGSIRYKGDLRQYLSKTISNKVLRLLIETGQINENNRYL